MATEAQAAALARLAADTKTACATSADITKAANAKAAAEASSQGLAFHTKHISYHAKAVIAANTFYFSVASGIVIGAVAFHLVNKYWLNKEKCC